MQFMKEKNVNPYIMLLILTGFQLICFFALITSVADEFRLGVGITFLGYILVEYAYFIGHRFILIEMMKGNWKFWMGNKE